MTVAITLVCLLLLICLIPRNYLWFSRNRAKLLLVLAAAAFVLHLVGYSAKYPESPLAAGTMAIFGTARLFSLGNVFGDYDDAVTHLSWFPAANGVLLVLAMLGVAAVLLSFWGYRAMCGLQLGLLRLFGVSREVWLFSTLNDRAFSIASSGLEKPKAERPLVLFLVDAKPTAEKAEGLENHAAEKGFLLVTRNRRRLDAIVRRKRGQALRVFAAHASDSVNVDFLADAAASLSKAKEPPVQLSFYALLSDEAYRCVFHEPVFDGLDIHPIFVEDLACRELFSRFVPLSAAHGDTLRIAVIGDDPITTSLFRYCSVLGQSVNTRLILTAIGENADSAAARFRQYAPSLCKQMQLESVSFAPNTPAYFSYLQDHIAAFDCFFVADACTHTAPALQELLLQRELSRPVWVYAASLSAFRRVLESPQLPDVYSFGVADALYNASVIINERLDRLAMAVHGFYCAEYGMGTPWEALSPHLRDSNRFNALHIYTKLYMLGLQATESGDVSLLQERLTDDAAVLSLAQTEHLRWNAYHYVNGWRCLALSQADGQVKDEKRRLHCCLVDWQALDAVSEAFGRDFKRADFILVEHLPEILQSAGLGTALWEDVG